MKPFWGIPAATYFLNLFLLEVGISIWSYIDKSSLIL
jgi:hypothetical protein